MIDGGLRCAVATGERGKSFLSHYAKIQSHHALASHASRLPMELRNQGILSISTPGIALRRSCRRRLAFNFRIGLS
jgi:hypothetical protein